MIGITVFLFALNFLWVFVGIFSDNWIWIVNFSAVLFQILMWWKMASDNLDTRMHKDLLEQYNLKEYDAYYM